jgi:hypothetical protein
MGQLRRDAQPSIALVGELFQAQLKHLACEQCHSVGLRLEDAQQELDDWSDQRLCDVCGQKIATERRAVFPNATRCARCQDLDTSSAEYCPRCGHVLALRTTRGAGVTRYRDSCPECGYRG